MDSKAEGALAARWVDDKKWDQEWEELARIGQGGQGTTLKVRSRVTGEEGCLKVLSKQNDRERRLRFAREANAYDTISHALIPRLLASNTLHHDDESFRLFLVTEFVAGPTLSELIEGKGSLAWEPALEMTSALLGVVDCLHSAQWVHRDIKSDNIILKDGDVRSPVLLDFGIGFSEHAALTLDTEQGQEIGNRFLRLPEHAIGSVDKRDPRSDLTFVGAVLFYALTGVLPATLLDGEGRIPHQRPEPRGTLTAVAGLAMHRLFDFFDRCFNPQVSRRYANAAEMSAALRSVADKSSPPVSGPEEDLAFIRSHLARDSVAEQSQLSANVMRVFRAMERETQRLAGELNGQFVHTHGGVQHRETSLRCKLGIAKSSNHAVYFSPVWEIDVRGAEIVVASSSGFRFRLNAASPDLENEFRADFRAHLLQGVRGLIEEPFSQVVYRGFFKSPPHASVREALIEANRLGRHALVVVFDEKHPEHSKLDYALGSFMEREETKNLVQANFVTAIVTTANAPELVPSASLEMTRWFLLDAGGTVLEEADVYANPDEGLKQIRHLVALARPDLDKAKTSDE